MRVRPVIQLDSSLPYSGTRGWKCEVSGGSVKLWCQANGRRAILENGGGVVKEWEDPLEALRWMEGQCRSSGRRWVGYVGYDLGRFFERLPTRAVDDLGVPLFMFTRQSEGGAGPHPALSRSTGRGEKLERRSTFSRQEYISAVRKVMEYIAAGDVFQVNLSQRFTAELREDVWEIYDRLKAKWPAAYGGCLDFGEVALICNSPELFLRVTPREDGSRTVLTRPIKGTRQKGAGMEAQLLGSAKDAAELNMVIDLERNDLGRVCEIGTVVVSQQRTIEAHPTVYHGVATIEGTLRREVGLVELLRATFPGGSVTGAPKIRAMEIIEELEPVRRGPYCGAIGYIDADGAMEFNVAIRTMIVKDGLVHIPVGGGIVADSDPAAEYEETLIKAQAMFAAVGISADDVSRA